MLRFSCTDRLKETRTLEKQLEDTDNMDSKEYNRILIEKLKEFQGEANSLLTEFVEKEKKAIASKELSNDHLKAYTTSKNKETTGSSSESESESENEENQKKNKHNSQSDSNEPVEKKPCFEN